MLNARLEAIRRSRETAQIRAAYDEFLHRLSASEVAAGALAPGDQMPTFLLPTAEGRLLSSEELLARGPLVVTFFRGAWCPYCAETLDALQAVLPTLSRLGGTLVALTPETGGLALTMKTSHELGFEVLVDVDLVTAMAFGIVFRTPPLYVALLRDRGHDLAARSGNAGWWLPVPATFLVEKSGMIARSWVNIDFTRRAEPTEILAALATLAEGTV